MTQGSGAPLVTLVTTAETVALVSTTPPSWNAPSAQGAQVTANVTGATGASVTSVQVRIRQGSTVAGALVPNANGVFQESSAASSFYANGITVLDPSPPNPPVYCVTVQQVGATGNGTVTLANISIEPSNASGA
jgi:hypothetical protein